MDIIIKKDGTIRSIEHLLDGFIKRILCVEIDNSIIKVGVGVRHLSCLSDEELIGRTATIQYFNDNGTLKFPTLLRVDDIFYKGIVNKR